MTRIAFRPALTAAILLFGLAACQDGQAQQDPGQQNDAATVDEGTDATTATVDSAVIDMVTLGGAMQAAAEVCGDGSTAELDEARQQQKQMFVDSGGSERQFDAVFSKAHSDTRAKYAVMSAGEREASCSELRQISEFRFPTQP